MPIFKASKSYLNYDDILQLDCCFSVCHINYDNSPIFNKIDGKTVATESRKNSLSCIEKVNDVIGDLYEFNGTEKNYKSSDRISLWKVYWFEYINAFDNLIVSFPKSIATVYIGRHAIEIGLKYLLLKKIGKVVKEHDLGKLSKLLYSNYDIEDSYMKDVDTFCELYCKYIEGGNVEYFRYPEYKNNIFFAGNCLDINWISYNFMLVILKLIHFAGLDDEIKSH